MSKSEDQTAWTNKSDIQNLLDSDALLFLNNDIASIRDKEDILEVVHPKLKRLFNTDDIFICILDKSRDTLNPLLRIASERRQSHADYQGLMNSNIPIHDGFLDTILNSDKPIVFDLEEVSKWQNPPYYATTLKGVGLSASLSKALYYGKEQIGILTFWSEERNSFTSDHIKLIQRIGDQISLVVTNILANESIRQREREKEILLQISKAITSIRDKNDLINVIQKILKSCLPFTDIAITKFNLQTETFRVFLERCEVTNKHEDFDAIAFQEYPIADGIHDVIMKSESTVLLSVKKLIKEGMVHIKFLEDAGIKELAGIRLQHGNETLGTMVLLSVQENRFSTSDKRILELVSPHFATAMANILYYQEIQKQLEEISRYKEQLEKEKLYLQEEVSGGYKFRDIIGTSAEMQEVFHLLSQVSFADSTVLLLGETGTGKELIARAIHDSSNRKDKLMVKVNCASIPVNLIESELFGHEKGAFTGAYERRIGKFELAHKGTLLLDEIGELPIDLQSKLLRAIQEKEIERVGGKSVIKTDVRIIAATNRDLQKEVREGKFRSDLYYRLDVFPITIPPLRNRKEDIPILTSHFISKFAKNAGKNISGISAKARKELQAYDWPGNVRELEHMIERSVLMTQGNTIKEIHLPALKGKELDQRLHQNTIATLDDNEREHILKALNQCNGKIFGKGGAAELLGINVSTLNSRIKKLGITKTNTVFKK